MNDAVTFLAAVPYAARRLFVAASPDEDAPYTPYTVWYVYIDADNDEPWTHFVTHWWAVDATIYAPADGDWALVGISNEGNVDYSYADSQQTEVISGAGVRSGTAKGWGYMSAINQIGDHLYACGGAGQVYKRRGPNDWVHMDHGILQAPDVAERLMPRMIDGPHENAIYLVGAISRTGLPPVAHFWNGSIWRRLDIPEVAERITGIYVESETRIWLCGANGTLLLGNAVDGFKSLSTIDDNQLFLSVCKFREKVYLSSNMGLFVYDLADPDTGIREVLTGLVPELHDTNIVDSVDAVLWSIGAKDIARFDGERWERIHHPDNQPIGEGSTGIREP